MEEDKSSGVLRELLSWVLSIAAAVVAAIVLTQFIIVNAQVPTGSMENTIMTGDRVIGLRLSYNFGEPERLDVVIFRFPDDESQLYVKRIIGLPGDVVEIADGRVYLNGADTPLDEPYVTNSATGSFGPYEVPAGCYFMLGDNRDQSSDSRMWVNTYVTEDQLVGKAVFRLWPRPGLID